MGARQARQRTRSSRQPSTGTLSCQATGWPQAGQREPGRTSDSPRGTRWMTTLAKEPKARPSRPASTAAAAGLMAERLQGDAEAQRPPPPPVDHDRSGGRTGGIRPARALPGCYHLVPAAARAAAPVQVAPVPYLVPLLTSSLIQKQVPLADSAAADQMFELVVVPSAETSLGPV